MRSWKREATSLVVGLVAFVMATMFAMTAMAFVNDQPPAGPECTYMRPGASGPGGTGHEAIRWSLLPDRVCIIDDSMPPGGGAGLLTFLIAGFVGVLASGAAASLTDRRLRATKQPSAESPS